MSLNVVGILLCSLGLSFLGLENVVVSLYLTFACDFINVQIHHTENKCSPFELSSAINAWKTGKYENICRSGSKSDRACDDIESFIYEISEDISSQLHSGVMKAARRVVLDEIIGNTIAEFVTERKSRRLKHDSVGQPSETSMLDIKMVMLICFIISTVNVVA